MKTLLHNVSVPMMYLTMILTFSIQNQATANNIDLEDMEPCMECLTAPLLFCPSTYFGCPDDNIDPSLTGTPVALPGDPNCPTPIVSYTDTLVINTPCLKKYHRIWKAQYHPDSASVKLFSQCVQTLYLEDETPPELSACPQDIIINLFDSCDSTATWTSPTALDDCGVSTISANYNSGDNFPQGSTEVQYIAIDFCGRQDSCSFFVNVIGVCCENLTLICPPDTTACVNSSLDPLDTGMATIMMPDSSCVDPLISFTDSILMNNPNCINGYIIQRTWTASDSSLFNIYSSCTQIITTQDNDAPQILNVPQDLTLTGNGDSCSVLVQWSDPVAFDSCGILAFSSNIPNGSYFIEGTSLITYAAVDYCANTAIASFTVTIECEIVCDQNPILSCPTDWISCPLDTIPHPDISGWAIALPGDSLCLEPLLSYSDSILSSGPCPGSFVIERTWTAIDPDNDSLYTTCIQNIILEDFEAPQISNTPQNITVTATGSNCLAMVDWVTPIVNDNCGIASFASNIPSGSLFSQGTTTVVYTAIDNCGLIATSSFEIFVECQSLCNTNPTIQCPNNFWTCPDGSIPGPATAGYAIAFPGSVDCNMPNLSFSDLIISSGPCATSKVIDRTWLATDPDNSNIQSSCVQRINLEDLQPPNIWYCPNNITVVANSSNCTAPVSWNSPLATDNCSAPNLSVTDQYGNSVQNGQYFPMGATYVTYTAEDYCGNTTDCQFTVTVQCASQCTSPPMIQCPPNKTVCPGSSTSTQIMGWGTATSSAYCPPPSISYTDLISSTGPCYGEKVMHRTWTASYGNSNNLSSSCVQTIKLEDHTAPIFYNCPANITVFNSATPVNWSLPYVFDNCGNPIVSSTHSPGSYFPLGVTYVTYTARDNCWNTSTCSFSVTVQNQYNIDLECPQDLYLNCNNNSGAIANWSPPSYNGSCGNCDGANSFQGFVYMGSYNGHQYYCSTSTATWQNAKLICESKGGYLASINDPQENNYLANVLTLQSAWIGLSDYQNEGQFEWESGESLNYTNWYTGQPNNYNNNQDYVEMLNDGRWNDQYNNYSLEFIMEIPCSFVQQVSGPQPGSILTGGTYNVVYEVQDACGGYGTCDFNIYVDGGLTVTCPDDIVVSAQVGGPGIPVSWLEPEASTCCTQCQGQNNTNIPGFVYMGTLNGHDYYCSTSTASWQNAKLNSELKGGYLAIIETEEENNYLASVLSLQSAWIGLSDYQIEGEFRWVNGQLPTYTNWYPGQPNNYGNNQDYVELLNGGQWNDQYNHYLLEYIMEVPSCINSTQLSGPQSGSTLAPGTFHTVEYLVTDGCGNTASCSFNIEVQSTPNNKVYCESFSKNSFDFHIKDVTFGQMENKTGDDGGYGDYTNICGSISQGNSYELYLTPSITQQDRTYWRVWIDFNQDGDFYDHNEMVAYGSGFTTISGIVTIPNIITPGETVMRVIMSPGSYPLDPCGEYEFGETEDYCLLTWGTGSLKDDDQLESRNNSISLLEELDFINLDAKVQVYPNPSSDWINFKIDKDLEIRNLSLSDLNGRLLYQWSDDQIKNIQAYSLENISSGVYILNFETVNNKNIFKKIIVSK